MTKWWKDFWIGAGVFVLILAGIAGWIALGFYVGSLSEVAGFVFVCFSIVAPFAAIAGTVHAERDVFGP